MYNSLGKFYEIVSSGREDNQWDFKERIHLKPRPLFYELLKDILAFGNTDGGWIVIGVNDDVQIVGTSERIDPTELAQTVQATLGVSFHFELNYYEIIHDHQTLTVGLLYIPLFERVFTPSKNFSNEKGKQIIQEDIIYVRRNTSSTKANGDDLKKLAYRIVSRGNYEYSKNDKEKIQSNSTYYESVTAINNFLNGKFKFTALDFSRKLNYILNIHQIDFNIIEVANLIGLESDKIDEYLNGYRIPKLEHILRATEIFNLPHDFFFQPTMWDKMTLIKNPLITHVLIEKVTNKKSNLFTMDMGKFIKDIIEDLADEFVAFSKWLHSERDEVSTDKEDYFSFKDHNIYHDYVKSISDEYLNKFKHHLKIQYYKQLETANSALKDRTRPPAENLILNLISLSDDRLCKFLNETLKEITIKDDSEVDVEYHFKYEVKNLLIRCRTYNQNDMKVEFESTENLLEIIKRKNSTEVSNTE